jgi:carbonic anhydrase
MKTLETTKKTEVTQEDDSINSLEFADVVVYNEMADQTSVKMNLIEQIHSQLNQLEEMNHKGEIKIVGALYDISTGVVEFLDA